MVDDSGEHNHCNKCIVSQSCKPPPITILIHGTLYDVSEFYDHPGGPEFLKAASEWEDATAAFEMHHMRIERARSRLTILPTVAKGISSNKCWDWDKHGFYATVRRLAAEALLAEAGFRLFTGSEQEIAKVPVDRWRRATSSTRGMRIARGFAIMLYVASFVATCMVQSVVAAVVCGVLTAIMGGFGHNAFHQRGHTWDCWLFECASFNHMEYRREHILHHMCPNLLDDPDTMFMLPFVEFGPPHGSRSIFRRVFAVLAFHIIAASASLVNLGRRLIQYREYSQGASVMSVTQLFFLLLSGCLRAHDLKFIRSNATFVDEYLGRSVSMLYSFGLWVLLWLSGSFYFMLVTSVTHNQECNWTCDDSEIRDCGAWQIATATDIEIPFGLRGVPLCGMMLIFLHEQILHHLFPTVDHSRLPLLRPIVSRTAKKFGLELREPQNYMVLYIGLLATIAGMKTSKSKET